MTRRLPRPTFRTPSPPARSMNSFPSTSVTEAPSPSATKMGAVLKTARGTAFSLRSKSAAETGPGISLIYCPQDPFRQHGRRTASRTTGFSKSVKVTLVLGPPLCLDRGCEGVGVADHRAEPLQSCAESLGILEAGRPGRGQEVGGLVQQAVQFRVMVVLR